LRRSVDSFAKTTGVARIPALATVFSIVPASQAISRISMASPYGYSRERIEFDLEVESMNLLIDTAMPLGLVVSEIVRHASPVEESGRYPFR
jgi:hypothetical protein